MFSHDKQVAKVDKLCHKRVKHEILFLATNDKTYKGVQSHQVGYLQSTNLFWRILQTRKQTFGGTFIIQIHDSKSCCCEFLRSVSWPLQEDLTEEFAFHHHEAISRSLSLNDIYIISIKLVDHLNYAGGYCTAIA